jgi:DNA-binding response OmpR family regulator
MFDHRGALTACVSGATVAIEPNMRPRTAPIVALVDSLLDEREMYEWGLTSNGLGVVIITGESPAAAAAAITMARADAVVTRIMPQLFGIELTRLLRGDARTATTPVIIITSFTVSALHDAARAAGADEVVLLPLDPDALAAKLHDRIAESKRTVRAEGSA